MLSNLLSRFRPQKASKGFDFLGKRILPIGVLPSQAALSRRQAKTVRLYEQGASKKRIWTYWVRWLGWAACVPLTALANPTPDVGGDTGDVYVHFLRATGAFVYVETGFSSYATYVTTDSPYSGWFNIPIWIFLPDDNPSTSPQHPVSIYSFAKSSTSSSIPPSIVCNSPNAATINELTYKTTVTLNDGEQCAITVTPKANGDPYADVVYTGTLSRSGNVYFLTGGEVCGGPYTACAAPPPVSASVDNPLILFLGFLGVALAAVARFMRKH